MTSAGALNRKPDDRDSGLAKEIAAYLENERVNPKVVPHALEHRLRLRNTRTCLMARVRLPASLHQRWTNTATRLQPSQEWEFWREGLVRSQASDWATSHEQLGVAVPVNSSGWARCIAGKGARAASRPPHPKPPRRIQATRSLRQGTPLSQHPAKNSLSFVLRPSFVFKV